MSTAPVVGSGAASVSEYLGEDHDRLDRIGFDVVALARTGAYEDALRRFADFASGLDRHIGQEERIVFPFFERATGVANGPTEAMRREHVEIRRLVAEVGLALRGRDGRHFAGAFAELRDLLAAHNTREEIVLYPAADAACRDRREREQLLERLRAF